MNWKICLTSAVLAGCATVEEQPQPIPEPVTVPEVVFLDCGIPPRRPEVNLQAPKWRIIPDPEGNYVYSLTAAEYEVLSNLMTDIKSGIEQLISTIIYYEDCHVAAE